MWATRQVGLGAQDFVHQKSFGIFHHPDHENLAFVQQISASAADRVDRNFKDVGKLLACKLCVSQGGSDSVDDFLSVALTICEDLSLGQIAGFGGHF